MLKHLIIWAAALTAAAIAASLWYARHADDSPTSARFTPEEMVQRAVLGLEGDPAAADVWTQSLVRAAAVEVEDGNVVSAEGDYVLAVQYQRERNIAAAEALFKRAILRDTQWSRPYVGLANLLARHTVGRLDEAEREIRKGIELEPDWARAHGILALILRLGGHLKDAEKEAKTAIVLEPGEEEHFNNYANLLVEMRRYRDAEAQYRAAMKVDPDNARPYYNLACLLVRTNRDTQAIARLKEAIDRAPNLREEAAGDPELEALHGQPAFDKLVTERNEQAGETAPKPKERPKAGAPAKK